MSKTKHPGHKTRFINSSLYTEICERCGAVDGHGYGGGWGLLAEPCHVTEGYLMVTNEEDECAVSNPHDSCRLCGGYIEKLFSGEKGWRHMLGIIREKREGYSHNCPPFRGTENWSDCEAMPADGVLATMNEKPHEHQ